MLRLLILCGLSAVVFGQEYSIWYKEGPCGLSKYTDAGELIDQQQPVKRSIISPMIVGGTGTRENEFPWQASIRTKSTDFHFCGGSIINPSWILTAAHCMTGETASRLSVVVGDHTRDAPSTVRQTYNVSKIVVHRLYKSSDLDYDIALIKLTKNITFNENVRPVCSPVKTEDYHYWKCYVTGWGTLSSGGDCCPQTLQYTTLNVTTNAECQAAYPLDDITADMLCATDNTQSTTRDSCQGDSGGPLVVKVPTYTNVFAQIGIVSWGRGCASGYPGVYTRVTYYRDWISTNIAK